MSQKLEISLYILMFVFALAIVPGYWEKQEQQLAEKACQDGDVKACSMVAEK